VLADHDLRGIEKVVSEFPQQATPPSYEQVICDVTDPMQVQNLIKQADEFAKSCDHTVVDYSHHHATLLVNCAGITRDNWISTMEIDQWDAVQDVNLKGTFLTCRYFLDQERIDRVFPKCGNKHHKAGAIVNIGSIVSEKGNLGQVNYAASKGGVLGLTRALAKEVAIRNVNVNAVVPGFIDSPMSQAVPDHVKERMMNQIPQRRFGNPCEVADLVSFLLSERSSYITGESIAISGMISL
jgi:NAD(P)-dependent dehydrogenase (short-subunit alcohol dehydrogenase family)